MCGIFGLALSSSYVEKNELRDINNIVNNLFSFSQTRGSEAAGIAINNSISINILSNEVYCEFLKYQFYHSQYFLKNL